MIIGLSIDKIASAKGTGDFDSKGRITFGAEQVILRFTDTIGEKSDTTKEYKSVYSEYCKNDGKELYTQP